MSLNWQVGHRAYYNWKKLYCQAVDKSCYSKPMSLDKSLVAPLGKAKNELSHETNSISKVPPTNQHLSLVVNYYNWNWLKILRKGRNAGTASWPATSTSRTSRNLKLDVGSEFFRSSGAQTSASWPRTSGWSSAQPSLRTAEVTGFSHFYPLSLRWSFSHSCLIRRGSWCELGSQVGLTTDQPSNCCLSNRPNT